MDFLDISLHDADQLASVDRIAHGDTIISSSVPEGEIMEMTIRSTSIDKQLDQHCSISHEQAMSQASSIYKKSSLA
jgi:hypothetical protein